MHASGGPATDAPLSTEDAVAMQKLQLNEAQWARILAENNSMPTMHHHAPSASGNASPHQQVAYLLSLEGDEPNPKWTWWETTLDALDVATRRAERREDNRFIPVARASIGAWCFHDVLARSGDDRMTKRYEETMEAVRRATPCLRTGETKEERLFLLGHRV